MEKKSRRKKVEEPETVEVEKVEIVDTDGENETPEEEMSESVGKDLAVAMNVNDKDVSKMIENTETKFKLLGDFIKRNLKQDVDYGTIEYNKQDTRTGQWNKVKTKPFLMKPGSEKFTILFNHRAKFIWIKQDFELGLFAVKCMLIDKNEEVLGEGYGSARVSEKKNWTENEAMKIACKRAQIDASLRTYGLSEHFTQDVEDMQQREQNPAPQPTQTRPYSQPYGQQPYQQRQTYQSTPARPAQNSYQPSQPNAPVTDAQMRMLFKLIQNLGKSKEWFEKWAVQVSGIQGIENLTIGWASKFIEAMKKKQDEMQQNDGLEVIDYDNPKRDTDTSVPPQDVELPEDNTVDYGL